MNSDDNKVKSLKPLIFGALLAALILSVVAIVSNYYGADYKSPDYSYDANGNMIAEYEQPKVDINTATAEELDKIKGIGKTIAQNIVDYRNEHGLFYSINQLTNVKGIGEYTFHTIRPYVMVSEDLDINDILWEETTPETSVVSEESTITEVSESTVTEISETSIETTVSEQVNIELININTASVDELVTLPGIGEVIAQRIVDYAKTKKFSSVEELMEVKGIGEKRYADIKDLVTVE